MSGGIEIVLSVASSSRDAYVRFVRERGLVNETGRRLRVDGIPAVFRTSAQPGTRYAVFTMRDATVLAALHEGDGTGIAMACVHVFYPLSACRTTLVDEAVATASECIPDVQLGMHRGNAALSPMVYFDLPQDKTRALWLASAGDNVYREYRHEGNVLTVIRHARTDTHSVYYLDETTDPVTVGGISKFLADFCTQTC